MYNQINAVPLEGVGERSIAQSTAQSSQDEIEQLRQEVKALRAMIEQQQSRQVTYTAQATTSAAIAPAAKPVMKLASGAEFNLYGNVRADASYQAEGGAATRMYNQINAVPLEGVGERS
ncbi:hypothetical protein BUE68_12415, partial [Corynebacterium diphtheriae]